MYPRFSRPEGKLPFPIKVKNRAKSNYTTSDTYGPLNSLLLLEIRRVLKMQSPNSSFLRRKKYSYLLGSFKTCEKFSDKKLVALHLFLLP